MRKFFLNSVLGLFCIWCALPQTSAQSTDAGSLLNSAQVRNHQLLFDGIGYQNLVQAAKERGGWIKIVAERGLPFFPDGPAPSLTEILQTMVCAADLVAVVSIKDAEPHLSRDQRWAFTDYLASVDQVLKSDNGQQQGADIVIARSGGKLTMSDGSTIEVDDASFPPLTIGNSYFLFLTFAKESGQYVAQEKKGEFRVLGQSLRPLVPDSQAEFAKAFDLGTISSAVSNQAGACSNSKRQ